MGISSSLGLLLEINADPTHAIGALELLSEAVATRLGVSQKSFEQFGAASLAAAKDLAYLGAGVTAIGAALLATAEHAAKFAEEVGHVAEKSGATTEQVSTLDFAAKRMGVGTDAVNNGLRFLARNLGDIAEGGGKKASTAFADLGINIHDADGKVRSVSSVLPEVVQRLGAMEAGGHRTSDAMAIFGRGGAAVIPMLGEFRDGLDAVEKQAASMGLVISRDDVEAATKFLLAQRTLTAELQAFSLHLGQTLLPYITELFIKLEHYPLLIEQLGLSLVRTTAYVAAIPSLGASLLALIPIEKMSVTAQKEMNQAITDSLVALDKEGKAALAAGIAQDQATKPVKAHTQALKEEKAAIGQVAAAETDLDKKRETAQKKEDAALTHLAVKLKEQAAEELKLQQAYVLAGDKILVSLAKLTKAEDLYAGHADKDRIQVIRAHEQERIAAVNHLVDEAKALAQLSGDWGAYAQAVWNAQKLIAQAHQDATNAIKIQMVEMGRNIAGMLGLEKEYVIAEAVFNIPKEVALAMACFANRDIPGGVFHMLSASYWGIAAGKAVADIAGSLGGGGAKALTGTAAGTTSAAARTTTGAAVPSGPTAVIYLNIDGVISSDNLRTVIQQISQSVDKGDVKLIATHTKQLAIRRS